MLEFEKEYFEQEVRDGFYLDTTMKTLWAACMEVMQKVAEVCDRHHLTWYAAYGTLLGAIRHEGFVPWDDDVDIWLKRKDYMKLMRVLPKELPEGYRVRSALTDEGYEQFHTCVNNGSGICITPEWLRDFHDCPFTVGIDIFPLDYLPRDESARITQKNLFALITQAGQLVRNLENGASVSENDDERAETERKTREEIAEILDYVEKACKIKINRKLIEEEKWEEARSELKKWCNYLAMMYDEKDADYLVEYMDYVKWERKKFPKEWFAEIYGAAFENFMVPVPAGYEQVLRTIYGYYDIIKKKTGMHEYPFYARQLRQLREYVKTIEQKAGEIGWIAIDEIEVAEESREIPEKWLALIRKTDDTLKKVVLSANDTKLYAMYGDRALDKLEETLRTFESVRDSVALWWRPHPVMRKVLDQVSPELGERYQRILDDYKTAGWGICDETDNVDRAVEACCVYYGDMNAVLQPFQNTGKPILLNGLGVDNAGENNEERVNEYRAFLSFWVYAEEGDRLYFPNNNYNVLAVVDKKTWTVERLIPFEETDRAKQITGPQCLKRGRRLLFPPVGEGKTYCYDLGNEELKPWPLGDKCDGVQWINTFVCKDEVYSLSGKERLRLWKWNEEDVPEQETWWEVDVETTDIIFREMDEERFLILLPDSDCVYISNVAAHTVDRYRLPDEDVVRMAFDGRDFMYTCGTKADIVCWNPKEGVIDRYVMPKDSRGTVASPPIMEIWYMAGQWLLRRRGGDEMWILNRESGEFRNIHTLTYARGAFFPSASQMDYGYRHGNQIYCPMRGTGEVVVIDADTFEVTQRAVNFHMSDQARRYQAAVLWDRGALLYEEDGVADLNMLIEYCN